jgi:hypothetical protein
MHTAVLTVCQQSDLGHYNGTFNTRVGYYWTTLLSGLLCVLAAMQSRWAGVWTTEIFQLPRYCSWRADGLGFPLKVYWYVFNDKHSGVGVKEWPAPSKQISVIYYRGNTSVRLLRSILTVHRTNNQSRTPILTAAMPAFTMNLISMLNTLVSHSHSRSCCRNPLNQCEYGIPAMSWETAAAWGPCDNPKIS